MKKKKLSLAISGGIDSTASSLILKKSGFFLEAIFMKNWEYEKKTNCNKKDLYYTKKICKQIKIKLNIKNFSKEYWENVFIPFIKNIKKGETPNPDIICNRKIKFNKLLNNVINERNFNYLATGHYAKIKKKNLLLAFDKKKDQTYFLSALKTNVKKYIIFPICNYTKKNIKKYIRKNTLINFSKKESMGICFIEERRIKTFINKFIKKKTGNIIINKKIIGTHYGAQFYTLGEKKYIKNETIYIRKKSILTNNIYITKNLKKLENKKIKLNKNKNENEIKILYKVKVRHQEKYQLCMLKKKKNETKIIFKNKLIALTPGQYIVLYKSNNCIKAYKL